MLIAALMLLAQPVQPIAPVPRYGPGSPVYTEPGRYAPYPAGPPAYPTARAPSGTYGATVATPEGVYAVDQSLRARYGRSGPPGTYLPKGAIAMQCLSPLARMHFHADHIDCNFTRIETVPGRQGRCTAFTAAGRSMPTTLTFLDYDPVTRQGRFDCRVG